MKRILFVSHTSDWSGPPNSLLLLLKHLRNRYDVAVLLPGCGIYCERLAEEGIPFFSFATLNKWSIPSIARLIRGERFQLVYGNNRSGVSRNALIAAKLARVPFICHVREMEWGDSWRISGFLRFADAVLAVSQACAASISGIVPEDRLHVVYNGIPVSADRIDRHSARAALLAGVGLSTTDTIIVDVGRLIPAKGQASAIEAMAKIVEIFPSARLLLVGSLDRSDEEAIYASRVRSKIKELNLDQHVFLLGFRQDVMQLLAGANLFLYASLRDSHPRSVLEAMSAGLPVVACAVDGVAETVVDGETGYLVAPGDERAMAEATCRLLANPELRKRMGTEGKRRVRAHFTAKMTAEKVGEVVNWVLERKYG